MRTIRSDLRHVWRGMLRRPGYAGTVALTLGLGIGATTTIYSVVDAMLVRPLPYQDADRLVVIGNTPPGGVVKSGNTKFEPQPVSVYIAGVWTFYLEDAGGNQVSEKFTVEMSIENRVWYFFRFQPN